MGLRRRLFLLKNKLLRNYYAVFHIKNPLYLQPVKGKPWPVMEVQWSGFVYLLPLSQNMD